MLVETKNASLDTMSVTIQALHVSGKQMTLAVFRQLPAKHPFMPDGTLIPEMQLWGRVRYAMKDETDSWLVASLEGVLYRCSYAQKYLDSPDRYAREWTEAKSILETYIVNEPLAVALEDWDKRQEKLPWEQRRSSYYSGLKIPDWWPSNTKTGNRKYYEDEVDLCYQSWLAAKKREENCIVINELPQLFIAV